jgi:uncharacterized integral membrane protein (TIGR00698 family)
MIQHIPGVLVSVTVAVAATFVAEHYGASALLFALLLGMALNFLSEEGKCVAGISFCASTVLRIGVALLGLRITFEELTKLGGAALLMLALAVAVTIAGGAAVSRLAGLGARFGVLTGGAVAICGASAALALATVLPRNAQTQRDTLFAIIGVTALSTLAMILYPVLAAALGLDAWRAGFFLGAAIHDVAQVVGAGYGMSGATGDTATLVKLVRVALLVPVVLLVSLVTRVGHKGAGAQALVPWFIVVFALLAGMNSFGLVPPGVRTAAADVSQWCLIVAIAAMGMKTQLRELTQVGFRPVALMLGETLVLAAMVLGFLAYFPALGAP